jgi:hypothetical protein
VRLVLLTQKGGKNEFEWLSCFLSRFYTFNVSTLAPVPHAPAENSFRVLKGFLMVEESGYLEKEDE